MANFTYEDIIPSLIENTVMQKMLKDGIHKTYVIGPTDGYVLHDASRDWIYIDPNTMEETLKLGYTTGTATVAASYDFAANPRELYAVPADSVPADQIFGGGGNHEVM